MNPKISERARLMAQDETHGLRLKIYWYGVNSNPYHRNIGSQKHNSSHTQWHNAFVDECNRIGRNIK